MIVWLYVAEWDAYVLVIYKGCLKTYQGFHNTSTAYALYRHRGFTSLNNLKLTHNVHEFIECLQIRRIFFTQYITSLRRQCVYSHQQYNGDDRCTRRGVKLCGVSNPIHEWIYGFNCLYHWQSEDQIACWKILVIQHSSALQFKDFLHVYLVYVFKYAPNNLKSFSDHIIKDSFILCWILNIKVKLVKWSYAIIIFTLYFYNRKKENSERSLML